MSYSSSFEEAVINIIANAVKEILDIIEETNNEERKTEENGK